MKKSHMRSWLDRLMEKRLTVKRKLSFLLFVQILLLVVWYLLTFNTEIAAFIRQSNQDDEQKAAQIQQITDEYIEGLQSLTAFAVLRDGNGLPKDIYKYLGSASGGTFPETIVNSLERDSANVFNLSPFVDRLAVIDMQGNGLAIDRNTLGGNARRFVMNMEQPWVQEVLAAKGAASQSMRLNMEQLGYRSAGDYLYCVRAIVYAEEYRVVGLTVAGIMLSRIRNLSCMQPSMEGQKIIVQTLGGDFICGTPDAELSFPHTPQGVYLHQTVRLQNTRYAATRLDADHSHAVVTVLTPWTSRLMHLNSFGYTFYLLVLALTIFMIWVSSSIVRSIKGAIARLLEAVDAYAQGDFSHRTPLLKGTEFSLLSDALNRMAGRIGALIQEVYIQKLEKKENELRVLRSQINPHFLYNALESARMRAYINQDYEVESMVTRLSDVLRYGLVSSVEPVTVASEIENIKEYLAIYNTSYAKPIELNTTLEAACMDVCLPRVTLQPLVENSIKHGFFKGGQGMVISLLGYVEDGECVLKLVDDGPGTDEETLRRLRERLHGATAQQQGSGIGLYNVHRRIALMFGEKYGIELDAQQGHGFAVSIRLPAKEEEHAPHSAGG